MSIWDPIGLVSGIGHMIAPSGQGDPSGETREQGLDRKATAASVGQGAQNAGAAASDAGANATAQHWYSMGYDWSPGHPAPTVPGTKAYDTYQKYVNAQGNAGAAASAAGTAATKAHWDKMSSDREKQLATDQQQRTDAGLDMMKPGAVEDFYAKHGEALTQPGAYQDWWNNNQAQIQSPGTAENYANSVLQKYSAGGMGGQPADFGTYYDRAATKATLGLNDQLSARGQYGSSVGLGMIGTQLADLAAQRAKDESTYDLNRSADQRQWTSAVGDIANTAEANSLARWSAGGQGAALSDTLGLSRWKTAESAANDAQNAQRTRGQDLFNNERGISGDLNGLLSSAYGGNNSTDSALLDAILALNTGKASEGVSAAQTGANQDAATQQQLMQMLTAIYANQASGGKK